ncbi:MAG: AarF/ABC1/UbiB kinase family protein, partial [Candidatus Eremiobacteraeota bacterium]|nr:AarF/ABC1/UbiB kinase family protein [Candidatus Eremiobacteraeota bacterium]
YGDELAKLQDDVPPVAVDAITTVFQRELGASPHEAFASFDSEPLASASIGQVHAARLDDGREIVVKVRKPGVRAMVERDLEILHSMLDSATRYFPGLDDYDAEGLLEEFDDGIRRELDYTREAHHIGTFARLFAERSGYLIPEVIREFSTSRVLTMTRLGGLRPDATGGLTVRKRTAAAKRVATFVLEPALTTGIFHADPHAGNVLVRDDGTIAVLDFGMIGRLNDDVRRGAADMFLAMHSGDSRRLTDRLIQLAPPGRPIDRSELTQRISRLLERYLGNGEQRVEIGRAIYDLLELIRTHGLRAPSSLALLFKAVAMTDGMIAEIAPDKTIASFLEPIANHVANSRLSLQEWAARARLSALDAAELSVELPRHADRVLSDLELGNLRIWARMEDADALIGRLERMVERANATMIAAACVVGMAVLFAVYRPFGGPVAAAWLFWIAFAIAVVVIVRTILGTIRSKRTLR